MTVKEIFQTACILASRSESEDFLEQGKTLIEKQLLIVNQALRELNIPVATDINQEIIITDKMADATAYATARIIASHFNDTVKLIELTEIYNSKRASALGSSVLRTEAIPYV